MKRAAVLILMGILGYAGLAVAVESARDSTSQLGTAVRGRASRTLTINGSTTFIRVEHNEIVTVRNQRGQSFSWQFDTVYVPTGFPLASIAPGDFESGDAWVYVAPQFPVPSD